jgi:hypothetical protein
LQDNCILAQFLCSFLYARLHPPLFLHLRCGDFSFKCISNSHFYLFYMN